MRRSLRTNTNLNFGLGESSEPTKIISKTEANSKGEELQVKKPTESTPTLGPQRPTNQSANQQKFNVRFDYKADRCKDFKDTGYCGFGDSCIFLHDRSEYKTSWELDAEYEAQQAAKQAISEKPVDYGIVCYICKKNKMDQPKLLPECGHRFCGECIISQLKMKLKCPNCKKSVIGTLKTPFSPTG
jgi:RING finger protein 113A